MLYKILVKTNKKQDKIYWQSQPSPCTTEKILIIETKQSPVKGQANKRVIELIAEHLHIPKASIIIKTGKTSKNKTILIKPEI